MTTINSIRFNKIKPIMMDAIQYPSEIGCLGFIAGPGIGKTNIWRQSVRDCNEEGSYFNAGISSLADLLGCGTPDADFKKTIYLPHSEFNENNHIMVDELTNAPDRGTFTALSNLMLEGCIPGHPTKYKKSRTFACNPGYASDLAEPIPAILINRSALYAVEYDWTDFINYALNEGIRKIHPSVIAFVTETKNRYLQVKEFTVNKKDGVDTPGKDEPFPTPRSFELLSDRLRRMERGLPTTVFEESYATVGMEAGKAFGDHYAVAEYLPKVSRILEGHNEAFPDKAYAPGSKHVMGPLAVMTVFNVLTAAETVDQYRAGSEWLFTNLKKGAISRDIMRTYADASKESIHATYAHETLNALGAKILGAKEWTAFLVGTLQVNEEASRF